MSDTSEKISVFGPEENLVGIFTEASECGAAATKSERKIALIFLNAGVLHRVGPHRLHVALARRYAARGIASFRLDVGGIGDSRALDPDLSFRESAVSDVRRAMDEVSRLAGVERFVLFGLCSGADNALATALSDERVSGIIMLDPYAYVTPMSRARKLAARVRQLDDAKSVVKWGAGVITRKVRAKLAVLANEDEDGDSFAGETQQGRLLPPAAEYGDALASLARRGTRVLAVYTGSLDERYNHPDQLFEVFPKLRGQVDRSYFPEANHMFTELAAQRALMTSVDDWLERF